MRIAHVTATFPPYRAGTGTVAYYNAVGAAKTHEVHVITSPYKTEIVDDDPPEITIHRLPVMFRVGNAPLMPDILRLGNFDLIHLHYPFIFGQEMIWLRHRLAGQRYVITYHQDLILTGLIQQGVRLHHSLVGRQVLLSAARVMATSLDYAHASRLGKLVPRLGERLLEMPNGIDTERFQPRPGGRLFRAQFGIADDTAIILFVGGLDRAHYFKGIDVLLRAFQRLDGCDAALFIIGDGELKQDYIALSNQLGIGERVIFRGRVTDEDLPQYYTMSDLLVLPSTTMGEAFGVVLLEAMASGIPVIASSLPGVRTVVSVGVDGFLAQPHDVDSLAQQLQQMLDQGRAGRAAMGQAGRAKAVARYAWD